MSDTTATMLQDKLNSIERNAYDGIDFSQEVTAAYVLADELGERIDQLKDENVKLRELVRDAWGSGHPDKSCGDCEIRDECHDDMERLSRDGVLRFSRCLFELRIENRMRELGIEVDG